MDREEEINDLRNLIRELSKDMSAQRARLYQLQNRLELLEKEDMPSMPSSPQQTQDRPKLSPPEEEMNMENFIGLRIMHLVGIVVLVIGISIGVKYAVDKELISEGARITLAYMAGTILFLLSSRLKNKYALFSAILFSGAMASLYFTTYAAFVYYHLFSFGLAFFLMVAITALTAYFAILYNRQEIAILGMIGAYGIPFLISANSDKVELFFAYILLINLGIAFLSFKRTWKAMILLAMLLTWALFLGWAFTRYDPSKKTEAALFLFAFYFLFAFASLGFPIAKKQPLQLIEIEHFLFNNVLAYLGALAIFVSGDFDQRSTTVTGFAGLIFLLQAFVVRMTLNKERLLFKFLCVQCILCWIFYAGMKWDGMTVTMTWLGIAVALFVGGVMTKMAWMRLMSILLTGITLIKLVFIDSANFTIIQKVIAYIAIGVLLLVLSFFYQKFRQTLFPRENE